MKKSELRESIIRWLNSQRRDFNAGLELLKQSGYKPHVAAHLEGKGAADPHAQRALNIELRNCVHEIDREARKEATGEAKKEQEPQATEETPAVNIEAELQKEYPAKIKWVLGEFHSLYQSRSILHRELKASGEINDEESVNLRRRKLVIIDAISHRMDILWGIFDGYKKDGSLPEAAFFEESFDPEKGTTNNPADTDNDIPALPDGIEELKKLKENLRIKITKAENRLEYQSETKGEKPAPMPEGPKRAELLKRIEAMKKQKEAVEYKIVELK
jgi:hypothetical protein